MAVRLACEAFWSTQDGVTDFLDEAGERRWFEFGDELFITRPGVYDQYEMWCRKTGHKAASNRKFYDRLVGAGSRSTSAPPTLTRDLRVRWLAQRSGLKGS